METHITEILSQLDQVWIGGQRWRTTAFVSRAPTTVKFNALLSFFLFRFIQICCGKFYTLFNSTSRSACNSPSPIDRKSNSMDFRPAACSLNLSGWEFATSFNPSTSKAPQWRHIRNNWVMVQSHCTRINDLSMAQQNYPPASIQFNSLKNCAFAGDFRNDSGTTSAAACIPIVRHGGRESVLVVLFRHGTNLESEAEGRENPR